MISITPLAFIRLVFSVGRRRSVSRLDVRHVTHDAFHSQFGSRLVTNEEKLFEYNAWDDVQWDEELLSEAKEKVMKNQSSLVAPERRDELEVNAAERWNRFYVNHSGSFFKDRNWIFRVFPELGKALQALKNEKNLSTPVSSTNLPHPCQTVNLLEVGCGTGNAIFPMLQNPNCDKMFIYCCDFAQEAIDILRSNQAYDERRCMAFRWDIADTEKELPIQDGSIDFITMVFVLSAIDPYHFPRVVRRLTRLLRPGGRFLFRDYGRYDMTQLRFKTGSAIAENFYARGDGTRAYFFTNEEIRNLFSSSGLEEDFNRCDNKLLINRRKRQKMYRVWLLAQFRKPAAA